MIREFEKQNNELCEQINEVLGNEALGKEVLTITGEKSDDTTLLMNAVTDILQFLEREFPHSLSVEDKPVQKLIFQNLRYQILLRLAKKLRTPINKKGDT